MLHSSNASSIEKNRRYLVIKGGGLPGCSGKKEGSSVMESYSVASAQVSGSTGEEEGEETVNTEQTKHHKT